MSGATTRCPPEKIGVYARVSTEEQASKPENSLDNQIHRCRQYLMSQGHQERSLGGVRLYREEGYSGKDTNRPELRRLVRDIRAGSVDLLVFTELSRVSRSVSDFLALVEFLEECGVQFISLREKFDTTSPHGRLIMIVLMALCQFERETTSLRTKLAMRDRAEKGLFNGGSVPFGYDSAGNGQLTVNEPEAQIVREAFRLYLENGSVAETANTLKERGYRRSAWTSTRGRRHEGGPLAWNTVAHILKNAVYAGYKAVNLKARKLPPEEELALGEEERFRLVQAVWEPIIDLETFQAAQDLLAENRERTANTIAAKDYDYVLQGIVRCGTCGAVLEGAGSKKQRYHYYRHPSGTRSPECSQASWRAETVEETVLGRLELLAEDEDILEHLIQKANDRIEDSTPAKGRALVAARKHLNGLKADHEALVERLMAAPKGKVPESFWDRASDMERDVRAAEAEVARIEEELEGIAGARLAPDRYRLALQCFRDVYEKLDALERGNLLTYLVDRVELEGLELRIALLGQVPEAGRLDVLTNGTNQYRQPSSWLRALDHRQNPRDRGGGAARRGTGAAHAR